MDGEQASSDTEAAEATEPDEPSDEDLADRAVVLQLLRDDHGEQWTRDELQDALPHLHPASIVRALGRLEEAEVTHRSGPFHWLRFGPRHLARVGLISLTG
jgi:hypothetical protein